MLSGRWLARRRHPEHAIARGFDWTSGLLDARGMGCRVLAADPRAVAKVTLACVRVEMPGCGFRVGCGLCGFVGLVAYWWDGWMDGGSE